MIYQFSLIEKILLANDVIPHPFGDASFSVGLGFALGSAVKLKIVDQLSMEFKSNEEIAKSAGLSAIGTELILDCLEALGYVRKNIDQYAFTKRGHKNLSLESASNFRYFILFCDNLYKGYLNLDETIRSGNNDRNKMLGEMSDYEWELFSRAMIDISQTNYKEVVKKIPVHQTASKVLDLGGSHGLYSIEMCRRNPKLNAVVMDLPPVQKYAVECIEKHQAGKSVKFLAGDFMEDDLPGQVDIALAFNIIHGLNVQENRKLANKVFQALKPGGIYVILDQIKGMGGSSQLSRATTSYMALNLLHQAGGKTYSKNEVDAFVKEAGFTKTKIHHLNAPGFGVIVCNK